MTWIWKDGQSQLGDSDSQKTFSLYYLSLSRGESSQNIRIPYKIYLLVGKKASRYYSGQVHILIHSFCLSLSNNLKL